MRLSSTTVVEKSASYDVATVVIYGNVYGVMFRLYLITIQNLILSVIFVIPHQRYLMNVHTVVVARLSLDYQEHSDSNKVSRRSCQMSTYLE